MKNFNLIILLGITIFFGACETPINIGCISPDGNNETRTVSFDSFNEIDLRVEGDVLITEGPTQEVIIEAATNIIDRLIDDSRVNSEQLILEINGCSRLNNNDLIIRISMPNIESLEVSGDGKIETVGTFFNVSELNLNLSGDGQMDLALGDLTVIGASISGDGHIECTGSTDMLDVQISGDGQGKFLDLIAADVRADLSGEAKCELNVTEELRLKMSGEGQAEAIGTAEIQRIDISGSSKVKNFELLSETTEIVMSGDGEIEISVSDELMIDMSGDGKICYKGNPSLTLNSSGSGEIKNCD